MSEIDILHAEIAKLEAQRETLLNALCESVRIITGQMPISYEIKRRFLESGELPVMTEMRDEYPLAETSFQTVSPIASDHNEGRE